LTNVIFELPSSLTAIPRSAFQGCTSSTSITIPNGVTTIGQEAFRFCTGLTSITIPNSVTTIGGSAFWGCTNLTINAEAASQPEGWDENWNLLDWDERRVPVTWGNVSDDDETIVLGMSALHGNFPNPFNPETTIAFTLSNEENVVLEVFNIRGQRVRTLVNGYMNSGVHSIVWNGRDDNDRQVGSGVYFYRMTAGDYQSVRRMILMK